MTRPSVIVFAPTAQAAIMNAIIAAAGRDDHDPPRSLSIPIERTNNGNLVGYAMIDELPPKAVNWMTSLDATEYAYTKEVRDRDGNITTPEAMVEQPRRSDGDFTPDIDAKRISGAGYTKQQCLDAMASVRVVRLPERVWGNPRKAIINRAAGVFGPFRLRAQQSAI